MTAVHIIGKILRQRLGRTESLLMSSFAYTLGQLTMLWIVRDLGGKLLALQLCFSAQSYQRLLGELSSLQRAQYEAHFDFDFVFPWFYGLFLCCWIARNLNLNRAAPRWNTLLWLPWIASACDYIENIAHLQMLAGAEGVWPVLGGLSACIKWGLAFVVVLSLLVTEMKRGLR
jgi:hypothetical protein